MRVERVDVVAREAQHLVGIGGVRVPKQTDEKHCRDERA